MRSSREIPINKADRARKEQLSDWILSKLSFISANTYSDNVQVIPDHDLL